ncbi:hypothetical protein ERJ75_001005700 [Trypanosoma vivax]|uniref:Uncharacterized protein n=1 Tax=Trypanosoma vivax (strain Y486) TaxID=1055687 RepID=G0TYH9_TRYVY|nr:hypothetical protein TRVL_06836 [Trypanosoma vivax]KAH8611340.1 hypothetical protein ERJ75_001005700 [Trypanosoma vivax]CCC49026.1 conserved hypothetical protein [Trypanosoma vivax Y486]
MAERVSGGYEVPRGMNVPDSAALIATTLRDSEERCCIQEVIDCLGTVNLSELVNGRPVKECTPFLRRLVMVTIEARVDDIITDILGRVGSTFSAHKAAVLRGMGNNVNVRASSAAAAEEMFQLIADRAPTVLLSTKKCPDNLVLSEHIDNVFWCRFGEWLLQTIRNSIFFDACLHSGSDDGERKSSGVNVCVSNSATALLLRRVDWLFETEVEECVGGSGSTEDVILPPTSSFTHVWDTLLRLLVLLCETLDFKSEEARPEKRHPLIHITSDCMLLMVERNNIALQEVSQNVQSSVETLQLVVNNFAWLKYKCIRLTLVNAGEVRELIAECMAGVLQYIVNHCKNVLHDILVTAEAPESGMEGARCQLGARISGLRTFFSGFSTYVPRHSVVSLTLERTLRPFVDKLLDGGPLDRSQSKKFHWNPAARAVQAFRGVGLSSVISSISMEKLGAQPPRSDESNNDSGTDNTVSDFEIERLPALLQLLEESSVLGRQYCQTSLSFRMLRRILLNKFDEFTSVDQ